MKLYVIATLLFLISFQSFCQDPPFDENIIDSWYLHELIIDDQSHIPDHLNIDLFCRFQPENFGKYLFDFNNSNGLDQFSITYDNTSPEFTGQWIGGLNEGICGGDDACINFFELYNPFYFGNQGTWFTYEVSLFPDNIKRLVIVDVNGNQAIYNTERLLSIKEVVQSSFLIYPNPADDLLFITSQNIQVEDISVFDIAGKLVFSGDHTENAIDVSGLAPGMYFLEITSENGKAVKQFIKE